MKFNDDPINLKAALPVAFKLSPTKAIAYLKAKGKNAKLTQSSEEMTASAHEKAFTVAGVMKADILQTVLNKLVKAQKQGTDLKTFKESIVKDMEKSGWHGLQKSRLTTIFNTNIQVAFAQGQYQKQIQIAQTTGRVYWKFVQVQRKTKRDAHHKFHNKVFHYKDPIWNKIYPPCGHNCKCRVIALTLEEVKKSGLKVDKGDDFLQYVAENEKSSFNIKLLEPWEPKFAKYDRDLGAKAKKLLQKSNEANKDAHTPYTQQDIDNLYSLPSITEAKNNVINLKLNEKFNTTLEETTAIHYYTASGYGRINRMLRNDEELPAEYQSYYNILNTALEKLPIYEGTTYRGVRISTDTVMEYVNAYNKNEPITHKYFTSSSENQEVASGFDSNLIFHIKSKSGRRVNEISRYGKPFVNPSSSFTEEEVLFKAGTKFKVTSVNIKLGEIHLEEL